VTRYLRKARIREPRRGGDGTLLSEPVLVFVGDQYRGQGEFDVFDQDASPVGLDRQALGFHACASPSGVWCC
jgi:hypothetical protein